MKFFNRSLVLASLFWTSVSLAEGVASTSLESSDNFEGTAISQPSFAHAPSETYGVCVPVPGRPGFYYIYFCTGPVTNVSRECTYSTISTRCG